MIIKKSDRPRSNAVNVTVTVKGFADHNGERAIIGTTHDGQQLTLLLSNKGKQAENSRRRSIEEYEAGFKAFGRKLKLVPGGVAVLEGAYEYSKEGRGVWRGNWLNVMAYDAESARHVQHNKLVILRMFGGKPDANGVPGRVSGAVYVLHEDRAPMRDAAAVQAFAADVLKANGRPAFIARVIGADGQVTAAELIARSFYDINSKAMLSPADIARQVTESMASLEKAAGGGRAEVIGMTSLTVTPKGLEDENSGIRRDFERMAGSFCRKIGDDGGQEELVAQRVSFKTAEDNPNILTGMTVYDPWGSGVAPELVGINDAGAVPALTAGGNDDDDAGLAAAAAAMVRGAGQQKAPAPAM